MFRNWTDEAISREPYLERGRGYGIMRGKRAGCQTVEQGRGLMGAPSRTTSQELSARAGRSLCAGPDHRSAVQVAVRPPLYQALLN
jgi:hypothetical protein